MFKLSKRSLANLEGVHPDLVLVVSRAIEIARIDFGVSEGLRGQARQDELVAAKKSTTKNSLHLVQDSGFSHATDLFVLVGGKVSWEHKDFRLVVQAVMTAAIELGVQIRAGALWRSFQDSPHIELDREYY